MLLEWIKRHLLEWLWLNCTHSWWENTFGKGKGSTYKPPIEGRSVLQSTHFKDLVNAVRDHDALFERGQRWWKIRGMLLDDGKMFW